MRAPGVATIVGGSLVREIGTRVAACLIWTTAVVVIHFHLRPVAIPSLLHSLVGLALGLLLVFRTNASYDRFWEGRKLWGGIVQRNAQPRPQRIGDIARRS